MKLDLSQWRLKKDISRIRALHGLHFIFFFLSFFYHNIQVGSWLWILIGTPIFLGFYHLYYQTLKRLYYTYWSFTVFILIYFSLSLLFVDLSATALYLRILGILFLLTQMWALHDPIYYPIVSWWEYDFRYRDDVKVRAKLDGNKEVEGRLTDIRRKAGCLSLFEEVAVGDEIEVTSIDGLSLRSFRVKVMSRREISFGRPLNYGVKFLLDDAGEREDFDKFYDFWKNERKDKIRLKFQE